MNYKEKLEEAKRLYESANADQKYVLESLFPELKESEDEKVRKALVEMVHDTTGDELWVDYNVHKEEALAWLEKRGENPQGKTTLEAINEEKVDNANKVEPKFRVGDWITDGEAVFHITSYSIDYGYQLETPKGTLFHFSNENVENKYHLWTIQDAKDGDVLVASDGSIFLFAGVVDLGCKYYIALELEDETIQVNDNFEHCWESVNGVSPATKEQRDLLFAKMKEAGYEWDAEKKELKEIEDEEYNGEDYGIDSLWHAKNILEETLGKVDGYQTDDGILEHKCAIAAVNKLYKQKPWSEEDEDYYDAIITKLEVTQDDAALTDNQMEFLKSLKGRVRPKQEWSEEDEKMIGRIRGIIEAYAFSQSAVDVNGDLCEKKFIDADIWLKSLKEKIGG